jgi:hypothetical protein
VQSKSNFKRNVLGLVLVLMWAGIGCNTDSRSLVLYVDAEYNPAETNDTTPQIHEAALSVAQTFTVLEDGKFDSFQLVLSQGTAGGSGIIRVDVRPVLPTGEPETTDRNSIITPVDVDTATLPPITIEEYTVFDDTDAKSRQVLAGQQYAIVVSFLSRTAGIVNEPIALVYGRTGDEYPDGSGSIDPDGMGFTNNTSDYFFRTFSLREKN